MSSQGRDGLFRKALKALPVQLREALVEAELDDPVVLRSFPRASLSRLGVHEGGRRSATYAQVWQTGDDTTGTTTLGTTAMDTTTIGIRTTLDGTATVGTIGGATSGTILAQAPCGFSLWLQSPSQQEAFLRPALHPYAGVCTAFGRTTTLRRSLGFSQSATRSSFPTWSTCFSSFSPCFPLLCIFLCLFCTVMQSGRRSLSLHRNKEIIHVSSLKARSTHPYCMSSPSLPTDIQIMQVSKLEALSRLRRCRH